MATDKKSVLLYCDIIHTVESLEDSEAGKLFKHYLRYINDKNPKSDRLTELLFEPIKQNLKRDLKKWESKSERNSLIAKEGWVKRKEANESERIKQDAINADKDTVTVKDNVKVKDTVKVKEKKEDTKDYRLAVDFWLKDFHNGWTFGAVQGKALKSILKKTEKILNDAGTEIKEDTVFETFKFICLKIPEWYADKDLQIIDSKFNEIISEIKNKKNGKQGTKNASLQRLANTAQSIVDATNWNFDK